MEKHGFIYVWFDKKRKMYYVGSHWGSKDDGYICSSNRMRNAYKRRPQDFKRRIIQNQFGTRKDLLLLEERWLQIAKKKSKKYYNLKFETPKTEYTRKGKTWSEEAKRERTNLMLFKWQDPEYRSTMIERLKGRKFPDTIKMSIARTGITKSAETCKKISDSKKGKKHSAETCKKISESRKGKKYPKIVLPKA